MVKSHKDRSILAARFRPGNHYALTWGIPRDFGGMTGALLHRSRAFVRDGGLDVTVLTLDDELDYPEREEALRRTGHLITGVSLVNIWDWFREHPQTSSASVAHVHTPISADASVRELRRGDTVLVRERLAEDGLSITQTDRFRMDGSLLVSDRHNSSDQGGRSVVLYDQAGRPVQSWGSVWGIYRHWLDLLMGSEQSYLIVDSKTAARFVHTYRRANVVTMHVVHGSHRDASGAQLRASRRVVLENLSDYDAVAVLSNGQRDDLISDLGPQSNIAVIPNGFDEVEHVRPGTVPRRRGSAVMLASLTQRKRISHAVKAVAHAGRTTSVSLDVYGEGDRRILLEKTIRSLDVQDRVHLRGHEDDARQRFATADFTLLTSSSEGLPLVLVEAMAAGCIPIAYDIAYGPADLIRNGENGFLVAAGDIDALAAAIVELQRMPERAVAAMRRRAMDTARRFGDRTVTRTWAREMERAFERKHAPTRSSRAPLAVRLRRRAGRVKRRMLRMRRTDR